MKVSNPVDKQCPQDKENRSLFEFANQPESCCLIVILLLSFAFVVPVIWLGIIPFITGYLWWFFKQKFRLPFRLPIAWKGQDYSNPLPGGAKGFRNGEGLLFLGNKFEDNEEIWITNDDARRHALVLGTTGSGKALSNETPVLTEHGWMSIGDLNEKIRVFQPDGRLTKTLGVFAQGKLPVVRMHFADGRFVDCSRDHLWKVKKETAKNSLCSDSESSLSLMAAADIGIQLELTSSLGVRFYIPTSFQTRGPLVSTHLEESLAIRWGKFGFPKKDHSLELQGTSQERLDWLICFLKERGFQTIGSDQHDTIAIKLLNDHEGSKIKRIVWSLGGISIQILKDDYAVIHIQIHNFKIQQGIPKLMGQLQSLYIEVVETEGFLSKKEALQQTQQIQNEISKKRITKKEGSWQLSQLKVFEKEMTCIKTQSPSGLFVMESFLITHNTELLLGWVTQTLMWQSGFLFVDGKGTTEFHGRAWSLVKKFGREDDYRILNFTDIGEGDQNTAGGPQVQSNTLNPFTHGTPDQLMNLIVSLMGDEGNGDMWKHRAMSLVTSAIRALCDMRDSGDVLLDVQSIREYLPLGIGVNKTLLEDKTISNVSEIPQKAWRDLRSRGGMIELYLRSLNDEFSETSKLALKGFFDSLPGFNLSNALNGLPQVSKAAEQHGFLAMQLTKPLGSLADDYGHIFRTPFGEVDIEDVVLNRRILVVLLPALQKAPVEMQNCGRIIVAILKMMMGKVAGSTIVGPKQKLIDAKPTKALTPFMVVLDEAGYYMVKGIDTMMAQARSLGFMIVISAQDMAAMQAVSPQIAESASANARLTIAGAMEDAQKTWHFLNKKFATHRLQVVSGKKPKEGLFGSKMVNRPDTNFVVEDRIKIRDMQKLREGEFYFLMESVLVKARSFYTGQYWTPQIKSNKYLIVRGPFDLAPNLDQSLEQKFFENVSSVSESLFDFEGLTKKNAKYFGLEDELTATIKRAEAEHNQSSFSILSIMNTYKKCIRESNKRVQN